MSLSEDYALFFFHLSVKNKQKNVTYLPFIIRLAKYHTPKTSLKPHFMLFKWNILGELFPTQWKRNLK